MQDALHRAGHRYLKILFVLALAGSSAMFFMGAAMPRPPGIVVVSIAVILGLAIEWSYFTVSCDLSEAISEGNKTGIAVNVFYTLVGGAASWFLFTNAALHVGWAPADDLLGLSRQQWAMILAGLIVLVIFILSARRKRVDNAADLQSIGRAVVMMLPNADDATRLRLLSEIASAASKSSASKSEAPRVVQAAPEPAAKADQRQPTIPASLLGNHHSVIVPASPLAPVYISDEESDGESGHASGTFPHN